MEQQKTFDGAEWVETIQHDSFGDEIDIPEIVDAYIDEIRAEYPGIKIHLTISETIGAPVGTAGIFYQDGTIEPLPDTSALYERAVKRVYED